MPDGDPELWTLTFRPLPRDVPVPSRVRKLLKRAAELGLVCVGVRDATSDESGELQRLLEALCERVLVQSEILGKRAERSTP